MMRSLIGGLIEAVTALSTPTGNGPPVPLASKRASAGSLFSGAGSDTESYMRAMGVVSTLFAIVDAEAEAQASVKWRLWKTAEGGRKEDREEITSHAALDIWNKANEFHTGEFLREAGQQHFELTGEIWVVLVRAKSLGGIPLEMWVIRPDRMRPIQSPEKFLLGYEYKDPDGGRIPLEKEDVLRIYRPCPWDPYRGMGAVQSMLIDLDSSRYAAEYNRNFFVNSAEPGGIIEYPGTMNDTQWDRWVSRWREQHQGVAQSHRVATLEAGAKWIDRKYTMRDMQFTELRSLSDEMIRKAFRFPLPILGTTNDVNRATAEAMNVIYGQWHVTPRANRWKSFGKQLLNLYSTTGQGLEFDYDPVTPNDRQADNAELTARTSAAKVLVEAGYDRAEVLEAVGLPDIAIASTPAAPPTVDDAVENLVRRVTMELDARAADRVHFEAQLASIEASMNRAALALPAARAATVRPYAPPASGRRPRNAADLEAMHEDWEKALNSLLRQWEDVSEAQRQQIEQQVRQAVEQGDLALLSALIVSSARGAEFLAESMAGSATKAGRRIVTEAKSQGVKDTADAVREWSADEMEPVAKAAAALLASGLAIAAGQEALRLWTPSATADDVAGGVAKHLDSLSDSHLKDRLGGVLWRATNVGRVSTLNNLPPASYYATEKLDRNTCDPCKKIDEKQLPSLDAALTAYGGGGYLYCEGRDRCRGTFEAEWETE